MSSIFWSCQQQEKSNAWIPLFNGKDLSNFDILNGAAEYLIEDNCIVGISQLNTPNTFLATKKKYGNFILEFEVLVDPSLNSGVQFRSISDSTINNGRVHGYQCEIESSPRKWAGGIYDEARRDWLYPLSLNEKGQNAFQVNQWNQYRIEAIGTQLRTWVNDIPCANLVDDWTSSGIIAFQVHGISDESQVNKKVKWRNIKIKTTDLENERKPFPSDIKEVSCLTTQLTKQEQKDSWQLLFDGRSTKGWKGNQIDHFPEKGWLIDIPEESLVVSTEGNSDLMTNHSFQDFELELDFKMTAGAKSAIKYYVNSSLDNKDDSAIGLEYLIIDDAKHPDAKKGKDGNRTLASLYDLIPANNLSESNRTTKRVAGIGQWNKARIISQKGHIEHWLNNVKVVEYDRFSTEFQSLVQDSPYKKIKNFGQNSSGSILLQNDGHEVYFRNIKIRKL